MWIDLKKENIRYVDKNKKSGEVITRNENVAE